MEDYVASLKQSEEEQAKADERAAQRFREAKAPGRAEARQKQSGDQFLALAGGDQADLVREAAESMLQHEESSEERQKIEEEFNQRMKRVAGYTAWAPQFMVNAAIASAMKDRKDAIQAMRKNLPEKARQILSAAGTGSPEAREALAGVAPEGGKIEELLELTSPEELEAQRRAGIEAEEQRKDIAARVAQEKKAAEHRQRRYQQEVDRAKIGAKIEAQHAKQDAAADAKELAEMTRNAPKSATPQQHEHTAAKRAVIATSEREGYGTPTEAQAEAMANEAIRNLSVAGNAQQAALMAVLDQVKRINQATQAMADQQQAMAQQVRMSARFGPQTQQRTNQTWGMAP